MEKVHNKLLESESDSQIRIKNLEICLEDLNTMKTRFLRIGNIIQEFMPDLTPETSHGQLDHLNNQE